MKGVARALLAVITLAALAGSAEAKVYGVNDIRFANDWGKTYQQAAPLGLDQIMVTSLWWPRKPATPELAEIPRWQEVVLVVHGFTGNTPNLSWWRTEFCLYVQAMVKFHPNVKAVQIWNEPHEHHPFWGGTEREYLDLLAECYDMLQGRVEVLAPGAHPDPVYQLSFVRSVRDYYYATRRKTPLFDGYSVHPYWSIESSTSEGVVAWAMDSLWRGLPQPSPRRGLRFWWTEVGMESHVWGDIASHYTGKAAPWMLLVTPERQAARITEVVERARCDRLVVAVFNFLLVDEQDLGRWQSGLLYYDGTRKPAFYAYQQAIKEARRATCKRPRKGMVE